MPMSPTIVCNNILQRSFDEGLLISPMKLQKIMYFIACEYQKAVGASLFSEAFEVWKYGPVLRSVYDEFKTYGKDNITTYAKDAKGASYIIDENSAPDLHSAINKIWTVFRNWDAIALSNITHQDGSGWSQAFDLNHVTITAEEMAGDHTYEHFFTNPA